LRGTCRGLAAVGAGWRRLFILCAGGYMDVIKELLPKDKSDNSNIDRLKHLTDEQIQPLIPSLLEWLQDFNWPIAEEILQLIVARQNLVIPYVNNIFRGDDRMWQYWMLTKLVPLLTKNNIQMIKNDLIYLSSLNENEDTFDIVQLSKKYVALHYAV
jgi:hypothetical protein